MRLFNTLTVTVVLTVFSTQMAISFGDELAALIAAKVGAGALLLKHLKNRKLFVAPFPLPLPLPFPVHKQPIIYPPPKPIPIIVPKYVPVVKYIPKYVPIHHHKKETHYEEKYDHKGYAGLGHLHGGVGLETAGLDHVASDSKANPSLAFPDSFLAEWEKRAAKKVRQEDLLAASQKELLELAGSDELAALADALPLETLESLSGKSLKYGNGKKNAPGKKNKKPSGNGSRNRGSAASAAAAAAAESRRVESVLPIDWKALEPITMGGAGISAAGPKGGVYGLPTGPKRASLSPSVSTFLTQQADAKWRNRQIA